MNNDCEALETLRRSAVAFQLEPDGFGPLLDMIDAESTRRS